MVYLEPIGGAKPKFSVDTNGLIVVREANSVIGITCPAQGYPLPSFRFVLC